MRHLIILGDGMADEPCQEFGGLTPLEAADTPAIDEIARLGRNGLLATVPPGYPPGSEIAHLSLLGYDPEETFEGRGPLEAAGMGIDLAPGEMALRCNLIAISEAGSIESHSAGHISSTEAEPLIDELNEQLGDGRVAFYAAEGYRNLMTLKNVSRHVSFTPPHDVIGRSISLAMPSAETTDAEETAEYISSLITHSRQILESHPINLRRVAEGKLPANCIWPWGGGFKPKMKTLGEMYGVKNGCMISAMPLIMGIARYAGLKTVCVDGATGRHDTNYEGKMHAVLYALREGADFVFLHVEASDDASHDGDPVLKKLTIENLDRRIVAPMLQALREEFDDVALAVLPDHPTLCRTRTHTASPVPFAIWHPLIVPDCVPAFSERAARNGIFGLLKKDEFIKAFLNIQF